MKFSCSAVLALLAACWPGANAPAAEKPADLVTLNSKVLTMDAASRR